MAVLAEAPAPAVEPLRPAGLVTRLLAAVLDAFVVAACLGALQFGLSALEAVLVAEVRFARALGTWIQAFAAVGLVPAYHVFGWRLFGRTAGKWALGIRVIAPDGGRPRLPRCALRFAAYTVSVAPLLAGVAVIALRADRRAWHDRLARTRVVRDPPRATRVLRVELVAGRR